MRRRGADSFAVWDGSTENRDGEGGARKEKADKRKREKKDSSLQSRTKFTMGKLNRKLEMRLESLQQENCRKT